jgi:trk system potassium uptake protein TrkH
MPALMKIAYILVMWLGRLEFMSVFALIGYAYSMVRGRR